VLADAEDLASVVPWWRRVLRTVALDSAVVDGWGDPVPLLRASLAEHEQAGEQDLAKVCRDLLRKAGAPTRRGRGTSTVPPGLAALGVTSREADVLRLLVEGATNAEIAERMFLSRRTVETHVAHLLQKTSTASRGELRDRALDLGTGAP
jgi:DNA-binding NarL/FixJ family response regulator